MAMKRQPPRENDAFWLPVAQAARAFAVSPQGFRSSILPLVGDSDRRRGAAGLEVFCRSAIDAMIRREADRLVRDIGAGDEDLAVGSSPALERYRAARAAQAEIQLEIMRGGILERGKVREVHVRWASILRQLGERLAKQAGPVAHQMLQDALGDCGAAVQREFGPPTGEVTQ